MSYRDDSQEIADKMNEAVVSLIDRHWSGWKPKGKTQAMLTPRLKPGQKKATSSFIVDIDGPHQGRWYRHSQGIGGYSLQLLFYAENNRLPSSKDDWAEAFKSAREFLGMAPQRELSDDERALRDQHRAIEDERRESERRAREQQVAEEREVRIYEVAELWEQTVPLAGTLGEKYLESRGIPPIREWPWIPDDVLRFHPALEFEPHAKWSQKGDRRVKVRNGPSYPAVVGKVVDAFGDIISIWQIYLCHDKPEKADLSPSPKIGRGPASGGAVRLGGEGPKIGAAEGIESALGAWALENYRLPVWATLSTSGMRSFEPPMFVERITIWPDGDKGQIAQGGRIAEPPGIEAARALRNRMLPAGIKCGINDIFVLGDALDLLQTKRKYDEREKQTT